MQIVTTFTLVVKKKGVGYGVNLHQI